MSDNATPDSNDFDFEKLDPLAPPTEGLTGPTKDDLNTDFVDDVVAAAVEEVAADPPAPAASPLVDLGFDTKPVVESLPEFTEPEPEVQPKPPTPKAATPPKTPTKTTDSEAPEIFKNVDPRVLDLIYWRDVKKSGVVFGSLLALLLSLALFSLLSVVAYLCLAALSISMSFVIYKKILQAIQKNDSGHPFKKYLELEISLPEDKLHQVADLVFQHLTCTVKEMRRLMLVEDMVDSLKFGLVLWVSTYIGAWFNGMTLIILALVSIFTLPKVYEMHQAQIDQYIDLARTQVTNVMNQIKEKIPLPGKKKAEKAD